MILVGTDSRNHGLTTFISGDSMLRAGFFSAGLFVVLWGFSFLMVDKVVFHMKDDPKNLQKASFRGLFISLNEQQQQVFDPPDWAAFSLLSVGSVTMLYSIALPKKTH